MITLKDHNLKPYQELNKILETENRCALVGATGTGKSYISGFYIQEHGLEGQTLVLVPRTTIFFTWKKILPKAQVITYQSLVYSKQSFSGIKVIICDEMHHLGAEIWGALFKKLTEGYYGKIIGLTATPIRFLDGNRDMILEFFDGNAVLGIQLPEAVRRDILPCFDYITALYSLPNKKVSKRNFYTDRLYTKLDLCKNEYSVHNILQKHLDKKGQIKAVVFVNEIPQVSEIMSLVKSVFPTADHLQANCHFTDSLNRKTFCQFESNEKSTFLYVVDILNEGIHLKGANVLMMFRKTKSPVVYLQQLGRGLSTDMVGCRIKIFDFVSNYTNFREYKEMQGNTIGWFMGETREGQIIQYDYAMEELELLEQLAALERGIWTKEEDDLLREKYQNGKGIKELLQLLPCRTKNAILSRAVKLGITKKREDNQEYIDDVKTYYLKEKGLQYLEEKYPQYSRSTIISTANRLGLKKRNNPAWTEEELDIIRKNTELSSAKLEKLLPNHSKSAIYQMQKKLGIEKNTPVKWTREELQILYSHSGLSAAEMQELFPNRSLSSIKSARTKYLELKREFWTEEKKSLFCSLYKRGGKKEVLNHPMFASMTNAAVHGAAHRYNIRSNTVHKNMTWTPEEEEKLIEIVSSHPEMSLGEIHDLIPAHTQNGIRNKIRKIKEKYCIVH